MFNSMNPQMMQMLMSQMQGGGATGFMNPGSVAPANGAPQLPQGAGPRGAMGAMPSMPSALGANGQPQGAPGAGGGIFSQLAGNPQIMQMLSGKMGGAPGGKGDLFSHAGIAPGISDNIGMGNFNPQDIQRMQGMFGQGIGGIPASGGGQGGIQDLLRRMFGG